MSCISRTLSLAGIVLGLFAGGSAGAATIVIDATDSGWYDDNGSHSQNNENYITGWSGVETRSFFVFDLSSLLGEPVVSATLRLWNPIAAPPGQLFNGYQSPDPSETLELVEVTTPVPLLLLGGSLQTLTYQDLGDGAIFGTYAISVADNGTNVEITLNPAAVAAIDVGVGLFAIGGHLTTLVSGFPVEAAFRGTSETSLRQLVIETNAVPEPGSGALTGIGLAALAAWRRRSRPGSRG